MGLRGEGDAHLALAHVKSVERRYLPSAVQRNYCRLMVWVEARNDMDHLSIEYENHPKNLDLEFGIQLVERKDALHLTQFVTCAKLKYCKFIVLLSLFFIFGRFFIFSWGSQPEIGVGFIRMRRHVCKIVVSKERQQ